LASWVFKVDYLEIPEEKDGILGIRGTYIRPNSLFLLPLPWHIPQYSKPAINPLNNTFGV